MVVVVCVGMLACGWIADWEVPPEGPGGLGRLKKKAFLSEEPDTRSLGLQRNEVRFGP